MSGAKDVHERMAEIDAEIAAGTAKWDGKCVTCVYGHRMREPLMIQCRRHAPQIPAERWGSPWPSVYWIDWCGDYKPGDASQ